MDPAGGEALYGQGGRELQKDRYGVRFSINGIQYRASAETDAVGYTPDTVPENPAHTLKSVLDGFLLE